MKTNKLQWIYLTGFFLILLLPLFNLPPWFSPPAWGKTIIFRSIISILLFLYISQSLIKEKITIKTSAVLWFVLGLLTISTLSTVFSQDIMFSLWGNPYRSGGLINFAFYIIFAVLAFLVLKKSDWPKMINFSIFVGIFVSLIAIFQQYALFTKFFVPALNQPWSTIGGSTFLASYLLILTFITLSLTIKSIKNLDRKWFFYLPSLLLFIFIIILTISRAGYLGLLIGGLYFILFWPKNRKLKSIVISLIILFILLIAFVPHKSFNEIKNRLSIENFLNDPRASAWKISIKAIAEKPLLGYGPENFSIAFDKHYDPSLPNMMAIPGSSVPVSWYDRAHNILLESATTSGILAPIIYLGLFISLFLGLQRIKKKYSKKAIIYHGIQASLVAYFTANLFGFDVFSTYLLFFLFVGLSMSLIVQDKKSKIINLKTGFFKYPIIAFLFIGVVSFIWFYNIVPFQINAEINKASQIVNRSSESAIVKMETILLSDTFLNEYVQASYLDIINIYILREPIKMILLAPKGIELLTEATELRPNYTRYWLLLGTYYNLMLENYQTIYPEDVGFWIEEANNAFSKASELSPKRQEIYLRQARTNIFIDNFEMANKKIEDCIALNPKFGDCYWTKALIGFKENNIDKAKENIALAQENEYEVYKNEISLLELRKMYFYLENYYDYIDDFCDINITLYRMTTDNLDYSIKALACYIKRNNNKEAMSTANSLIWNNPQTSNAVKNLINQSTITIESIPANLGYLKIFLECNASVALYRLNTYNLDDSIKVLACFIKNNYNSEALFLANDLLQNNPNKDKVIRDLLLQGTIEYDNIPDNLNHLKNLLKS